MSVRLQVAPSRKVTAKCSLGEHFAVQLIGWRQTALVRSVATLAWSPRATIAAPDPTNHMVVLMAVTVLARFDRVRSAAALSGGFITSAELAKLGVPYPTATRWCANGLLARFHRGVYRVGGLSFGFDEAVHLASKLMTE